MEHKPTPARPSDVERHRREPRHPDDVEADMADALKEQERRESEARRQRRDAPDGDDEQLIEG